MLRFCMPNVMLSLFSSLIACKISQNRETNIPEVFGKVPQKGVWYSLTQQARNQGGGGGVHGVRSHPPTGPKGPHFDTQYPS